MAIDWRRYWWQPGFAAGFLAVGVPHWLAPYNQGGPPVTALGAVVIVAAAALSRAFSGRHFWRVVAIMGAVVPAAVLVRVVVDVLRDPTSHNLWPFEVVIAAIVGAGLAFVGTLLGGVVSWLDEGKNPMSD